MTGVQEHEITGHAPTQSISENKPAEWETKPAAEATQATQAQQDEPPKSRGKWRIGAILIALAVSRYTSFAFYFIHPLIILRIIQPY